MAIVDPNNVASAGIRTLQGAIDKLNGLKLQPGADIVGIDAQIQALQDKQDDLRDQALRTIEDSDANKQAIAAMTKAAASLSAEAANIKDVATALGVAQKVVAAAGSLIAALAPFI
jgi:hypothetical protein